jgi:predicted RNase H-like HicB family nuclease
VRPTRTVEYIAFLHRDQGSYDVSFPDFPGIITAGRTLEEAQERAPEALQLHVEGMEDDGLPIPEPSSMAAAMDHEGYANSVTFEVAVEVGGEE